MDMTELVRTVVQEVLARTRETSCGPCVMVLGGRESHLVERLHKELGADVALQFWGEDSGVTSPQRVLLPRLSCRDMADLAAGRASGSFCGEVLDLLLQGREVEVLEYEYTAYSETAPGPLYRLYLGYAETLAGYGLKPFVHRAPDSYRLWDEVVTAEAVARASASGAMDLLVPVTAKVTPLAVEEAGKRHMNIHKRL